jgi:hypothetical protein
MLHAGQFPELFNWHHYQLGYMSFDFFNLFFSSINLFYFYSYLFTYSFMFIFIVTNLYFPTFTIHLSTYIPVSYFRINFLFSPYFLYIASFVTLFQITLTSRAHVWTLHCLRYIWHTSWLYSRIQLTVIKLIIALLSVLLVKNVGIELGTFRILATSRKIVYVKWNSSFSSPCPLALQLNDSAGRIFRKLWWMNHEFSHADIIPPWFSMPIYHLVDEQ